MQLIQGIHNWRSEHRGCVLSIGNYDGVHKGHQQILARLRDMSAELNLPSAVMIFEPQPIEFFAPEKAPARLMRLPDKVTALAQYGIDRVLCVTFNKRFSELDEHAFIRDLLVERMGVRKLVVGDDFRFGYERKGNFDMLVSEGKKIGFDVEDTESFLINDERVSSTLIRACLKEGNFKKAESLLGRPYQLRGKIAYGDQIGRTIGFPTANVSLQRMVSPLSGVFFVRVRFFRQANQPVFYGVANIGKRPTVGGTKERLEVHLLNFQGDIYGEHIAVEFIEKLREEKKFNGLDELKAAIAQNIEQAEVLVKRMTDKK